MFEVFDDNVILDMLKLLSPTYYPLLSSQKGIGFNQIFSKLFIFRQILRASHFENLKVSNFVFYYKGFRGSYNLHKRFNDLSLYFNKGRTSLYAFILSPWHIQFFQEICHWFFQTCDLKGIKFDSIQTFKTLSWTTFILNIEKWQQQFCQFLLTCKFVKWSIFTIIWQNCK